MEELSIKSMLCVLKREILMDSYFEHLKHMLTVTPMDKKRVYTQKFAYHELCNTSVYKDRIPNPNPNPKTGLEKKPLLTARLHKTVYILGRIYEGRVSCLKDICGYFQCAPFPRLQTRKVVWVLSFDP